jgi:hypothetical protein
LATHVQEIAEKASKTRADIGGPQIIDINTGFIRDSNGLANLFGEMEKGEAIYTEEDFLLYGGVITQLKETIEQLYGINELYFTAPTFISRLDGRPEWDPSAM